MVNLGKSVGPHTSRNRMDIIHHTLIGGVGFLAALSGDAPIAGAAFMAGSIFPDLDAFLMFGGKQFYLRNHQGVTHSVLLAPVYAALVAGAFTLIPEIGWSWAMFAAALAGLLVHVTLDWLNTFRIALLLPLDARRFSADAVFFVDAVTLALTAAFYPLYLWLDFVAAIWLYPLLFVAYLAAKYWLRLRVGRLLEPLFAIPSSLNPFEFFILEMQGDAQVSYLYNAFSGNKKGLRSFAAIGAEHRRLAEQSEVFRNMTRITRAFRITEVNEDPSGTTIRAADVAVRNFGGRFGAAELRFNNDGKLIHEMANI